MPESDPSDSRDRDVGDARAVVTIAWTLIAAMVVALPVLIALVPVATSRWFALGGLQIGIGTVALIAVRLRRLAVARYVLVVPLWFAVAAAAWTGGGMSAPVFVGLVFFVALASLLLGQRAAVVSLAVSVASVVGLTWAEVAGELPEPSFIHTPWSRAVVFLLFGVQVGVVVLLTVTELRRTREVALREVEERRAAEAELAALNTELEQRVEQRTRQLETTNEELEAFAYSVSHDLRAPLRAIDGFSQALIDDEGLALSPSGRHYLERVRGGAQRMGRLIDSLLALSRLSRRPLQIEEVDLSLVAVEATEALRDDQPGRTVVVRVAPGLAAVTDRELAAVVFANLLANAWKFSRERAEAHIEVGEALVDGAPALFVRDDGVGFDPSLAARLFTPSGRLHADGDYEGSGVGLATVRRAVTRLGGRCWAEGEPGAGATFWFTLSAAESGAPATSRSTA